MVYDEETVVVVSAQNTTYLTRDGDVTKTQSGRWTIPTTEGDLTVVKQGGCSCGKPWLSQPSATDLLASVPAS